MGGRLEEGAAWRHLGCSGHAAGCVHRLPKVHADPGTNGAPTPGPSPHQVTVVDEHRIVVNDILNENADELPEFRDRVIKVSLGGCHGVAAAGATRHVCCAFHGDECHVVGCSGHPGTKVVLPFIKLSMRWPCSLPTQAMGT